MLRKFITTVITIITFIPTLFGQKIFLGEPLYGKVKSINYVPKRYPVNAEEYQGIFQDYSDRINEYQRKYEFDAKQNITKETGLDFNFIRKYDAKNRLIEEISHSPQRKVEELSTKKTIEYTNNLITKITQYQTSKGKDLLVSTMTYKHNSKNQMIEEITKTFDPYTSESIPRTTERKIYEYGKSNLPSSYTFYNSAGKSFSTNFTYDEKLRKLKQITLDANKQKETSSIYYSYDDSKHITVTKYQYEGKLTSTETFRYNSKNRVIERASVGSDRKFQMLCNYDEKGRLMTSTYIINDKLAYIKTYKHDHFGNIIECTYSNKDKKPVFGYTLDITYFP